MAALGKVVSRVVLDAQLSDPAAVELEELRKSHRSARQFGVVQHSCGYTAGDRPFEHEVISQKREQVAAILVSVRASAQDRIVAPEGGVASMTAAAAVNITSPDVAVLMLEIIKRALEPVNELVRAGSGRVCVWSPSDVFQLRITRWPAKLKALAFDLAKLRFTAFGFLRHSEVR